MGTNTAKNEAPKNPIRELAEVLDAIADATEGRSPAIVRTALETALEQLDGIGPEQLTAEEARARMREIVDEKKKLAPTPAPTIPERPPGKNARASRNIKASGKAVRKAIAHVNAVGKTTVREWAAKGGHEVKHAREQLELAAESGEIKALEDGETFERLAG